jgi:hypothetical protein
LFGGDPLRRLLGWFFIRGRGGRGSRVTASFTSSDVAVKEMVMSGGEIIVMTMLLLLTDVMNHLPVVHVVLMLDVVVVITAVGVSGDSSSRRRDSGRCERSLLFFVFLLFLTSFQRVVSVG